MLQQVPGLLGRLGLAARTSIALLVFILAGSVVGIMLSLGTLDEAYTNYFVSSMKRMAVQMCASVKEPVITGDYSATKGIIESMAVGQEIHALYLREQDGQHIHEVHVLAPPAAPRYPNWFRFLLSAPVAQPQGAELIVGGRTYGSCWVVPSQVTFMNVAWDAFIRQTLVWIVTGFSMMLVLVAILRSGLMPLRRMVEAVRGDAAAPSMDVSAPPEIRQAVMVLNQLSQAHGEADRSVVDAALSQLSQYQAAINSSAIVIETDLAGKIFFVNDAYARVACVHSDNPNGRPFCEVFSGAPETAFAIDTPWSAELSFRLQTPTCWVIASAYPILEKTGRLLKWVVIANDITARKRLEEDLLRAMTERTRLLSEISHATEDERKRIAGELHDEMGQRLVSLMMDADIATHFVPRDAQNGRDALARLRESLLSMYKQVNLIIDEMRPPLLETLGFEGAIHALVDEWRARMCNVQFSVSVSSSRPFGNAAQVAVFRIVQEALTNIAKHAKTPHNVRVIVASPNDLDIQVTIEDDGIGINEKSGDGLGLSTMRERAISLGGTFAVTSEIAKGTRIVATMPAAWAPPAL